MNRSKKHSSVTVTASKSTSNLNSSSSSTSSKKPAVKRPSKRADVDEMEEGIYELSHIIGKFIEDDGSIFYKVAWVGFPKPTIEPAENLASASRLVDEFESKLAESQARKKAIHAKAQAQQLVNNEHGTALDQSPPSESTHPASAAPIVESKINCHDSPAVKEAVESDSNKTQTLVATSATSTKDVEAASSSASPPSPSPSASPSSIEASTNGDASIATAKGSRSRKQREELSDTLIVSGKRSRRKTDDLSPLRPEEERALRQEEKINKLLNPLKQQKTDTNKKPRTNNGEEDDEDQQEWQMRKIVGTRKDEDGIVYYKVDWMPSESGEEYDPTWEPRENILDDSLILEFNERIKKGRKIRPNGIVKSQSPATNNDTATTASPTVTASVEVPAESTVGIINEDDDEADAAEVVPDAIMKDTEEKPASGEPEVDDTSKAAHEQPSTSPASDTAPQSLTAAQSADVKMTDNEDESLQSPVAVDEQKQPQSDSPSALAKTLRNLRHMVGLE